MSTTPMTEERKGQIALAWFELRMSKEGIRLNHNMLRDIGNDILELKKIGLETNKDELESFMQEVLTKLIGRTFGYRRVSLTFSEKEEE